MRLKNIVDCMQWLSYVLHHSCLCVVRRPLVVATTVGEDEETPPPQNHYNYPLFYQGVYSLCVCTQVHMYRNYGCVLNAVLSKLLYVVIL